MSDGSEFVRVCGCYVSHKDRPKVAIEADLSYCDKHGNSAEKLAKLIRGIKIEAQFKLGMTGRGDIDKWDLYFCTTEMRDALAEAMGKEVKA